MKIFRKIRIILLFALIISIPSYFTFVYYYSLSEADFLSDQYKLEARDTFDLQAGLHEKSKVFIPVSSSHLLPLDVSIAREFGVISFQIFSCDLPAFCLRC